MIPPPISLADLQFWQRDEARLALIGAVALTAVLAAWRALQPRRPGRDGIVLPAVLRGRPSSSYLAWTRYLPVIGFALGIPFATLALADPYSALVSTDVTFPGRRISLMIDASTSMTTTFKTETLNTLSKSGAAFFTTVAAAERFVELRQQGPQF